MYLIMHLCLQLGKCGVVIYQICSHYMYPLIRPGSNWTHEQASEMMLEYLVDDNNIDLDSSDIHFIKDLIAGEPRCNR